MFLLPWDFINSLPIYRGLYLTIISMESSVVNNPNPSSSLYALSKSYRMTFSKYCISINIESIDFSNRYSYDLLVVFHNNRGFHQVLRSELYWCPYYIMVGYACLYPGHTLFDPRIHPLEEGLLILDVGQNIFNLCYTWHHMELIQSQLIP